MVVEPEQPAGFGIDPAVGAAVGRQRHQPGGGGEVGDGCVARPADAVQLRNRTVPLRKESGAPLLKCRGGRNAGRPGVHLVGERVDEETEMFPERQRTVDRPHLGEVVLKAAEVSGGIGGSQRYFGQIDQAVAVARLSPEFHFGGTGRVERGHAAFAGDAFRIDHRVEDAAGEFQFGQLFRSASRQEVLCRVEPVRGGSRLEWYAARRIAHETRIGFAGKIRQVQAVIHPLRLGQIDHLAQHVRIGAGKEAVEIDVAQSVGFQLRDPPLEEVAPAVQEAGIFRFSLSGGPGEPGVDHAAEGQVGFSVPDQHVARRHVPEVTDAGAAAVDAPRQRQASPVAACPNQTAGFAVAEWSSEREQIEFQLTCRQAGRKIKFKLGRAVPAVGFQRDDRVQCAAPGESRQQPPLERAVHHGGEVQLAGFAAQFFHPETQQRLFPVIGQGGELFGAFPLRLLLRRGKTSRGAEIRIGGEQQRILHEIVVVPARPFAGRLEAEQVRSGLQLRFAPQTPVQREVALEHLPVHPCLRLPFPPLSAVDPPASGAGPLRVERASPDPVIARRGAVEAVFKKRLVRNRPVRNQGRRFPRAGGRPVVGGVEVGPGRLVLPDRRGGQFEREQQARRYHGFEKHGSLLM